MTTKSRTAKTPPLSIEVLFAGNTNWIMFRRSSDIAAAIELAKSLAVHGNKVRVVRGFANVEFEVGA